MTLYKYVGGGNFVVSGLPNSRYCTKIALDNTLFIHGLLSHLREPFVDVVPFTRDLTKPESSLIAIRSEFGGNNQTLVRNAVLSFSRTDLEINVPSSVELVVPSSENFHLSLEHIESESIAVELPKLVANERVSRTLVLNACQGIERKIEICCVGDDIRLVKSIRLEFSPLEPTDIERERHDLRPTDLAEAQSSSNRSTYVKIVDGKGTAEVDLKERVWKVHSDFFGEHGQAIPIAQPLQTTLAIHSNSHELVLNPVAHIAIELRVKVENGSSPELQLKSVETGSVFSMGRGSRTLRIGKDAQDEIVYSRVGAALGSKGCTKRDSS